MTTRSILLAITDPLLHPEVMNIAAATGREIIDTADPREITTLASKTGTIIADAATVNHVRAVLDSQRNTFTTVLLAYPEPGPIDWKLALKAGTADAFILPAQATELLAALRNSTSRSTDTDPQGSVIAISSATGGAGCSTIAAALALYSHHVTPTVLIDADPQSGGLDLLLGCEDCPGIRWIDLTSSDGVLEGADLIAALPHSASGLPVLSVDRQSPKAGITEEKLQQVIAALRPHYRLIIDIPAHAHLLTTVLSSADTFYLVIPPEVRAAAAASRMLGNLRKQATKATSRLAPSGIIRHRGWAGLRLKDVESIVGITIAAEVGSIPTLPKKIECFGLNGTATKGAGLPRSLERMARSLLVSNARQVAA